jgi:hypothetical protein
VIIIPFVVVLLVLGVITGLVGLVWLPAATLPGGVVFYILQLYEWVSRFFNALPFAMIRTGGGSLPVALSGIAVLLLFAYVMHDFGSEIKRRVPLLFFGVAALMFCVYITRYPFRLQITELSTRGNYTVYRHHGNTQITSNGSGGEQEVVRYLNMRGVQRANSLFLDEWPRPGDALRLAVLLPRVEMLFLQGEPRHLPEYLQTLVEKNNVMVIFIPPA